MRKLTPGPVLYSIHYGLFVVLGILEMRTLHCDMLMLLERGMKIAYQEYLL